MTGREWKPGDVAMVEMGHGPTVAIWTGEFWAWSNGDGPYDGVSHCHHSVPARPVVVIDPEDAKSVERLHNLVMGDFGIRSRYSLNYDTTAAALREFANPTPPKPAEPTGLGAVVEDTEGIHWVRIDGDNYPWFSPESRDFSNYRAIEAARILSEGVPS